MAAVVPPTSAAALGLLDVREGPAPATQPPIDAGTLPVFAGKFEAIALPRKVRPILAVTGNGDRDVWLLAAGGPVMRWDGTSVADRGTPSCFTDACCGRWIDCARKPGRCKKKGSCSFEDATCVEPVGWSFLDAARSSIVVGGSQYTGGMRPSVVFARPGASGWVCEQGTDDNVYPGSRGSGDPGHAEEVTLEGVAIRFEGPAHLVNSYGGYHLTIAGRAVPLPDELDLLRKGFLARSPGDLWLWNLDEGHLFHGDGLTWTPVETGLGSIEEVWATPGFVWVLGDEVLVQRGVDAGTERRYSVPGARSVLAGAAEFWLLGREANITDAGPIADMKAESFYFWDGKALSRAAAPLAFGAAFRSPSGDVWIAGAERKSDEPAGAVVRVAAAGRKP